MKNDYRTSKTIRFLTGRGFYLVLGLCMVAIGIAAWSMASTLSKPPETAGLSSESNLIDATSSKDEQAGTNVSGIPATSSSKPSDTSSKVSSQPAATETAAPVANFFVLPVTGDILKNFSNTELQYSLTYGDFRLHEGLDIAANAGTAVKAAGAGKVTEVKKDPLWGNMVVIDHGKGVVGYYCGLADQILVKKGQNVESGDKLGTVGTVPCESLDPPHLHLAFTKDGKYISPLSLVNMEDTD